MSRILIVDDNKDVLPIMKMLLNSQGFDVEVTSKGEEIFELLNRFKPSLIFIDIQLYGIDGVDISKKIKNFRTNKTYCHNFGFCRYHKSCYTYEIFS